MCSPVSNNVNFQPFSNSVNEESSWHPATPSKLNEKVSAVVQSQVLYNRHTNPQVPVESIKHLESLVKDPVLFTDTFISCYDQSSRAALETAKNYLFKYYKSDRVSQESKDHYVYARIKVDAHRMHERKRPPSANPVGGGFPAAFEMSSPGTLADKLNQYLDKRQALINYYSEEFSKNLP